MAVLTWSVNGFTHNQAGEVVGKGTLFIFFSCSGSSAPGLVFHRFRRPAQTLEDVTLGMRV
jgi:hypothetical protein